MLKKGIIVLGSSRSNGNTRKIIDLLNKEQEFDFIDLNNYQFSYYDYEHKNLDDDYLKIIRSILQHKHIIFATPIYWYSMSGIMKVFFDRITDLLSIEQDLGRQLRGKTMSLISCSSDAEQYEGFNMPFVNSAEYLGMHFQTSIHTWLEADQIPTSVQLEINRFRKQLVGG